MQRRHHRAGDGEFFAALVVERRLYRRSAGVERDDMPLRHCASRAPAPGPLSIRCREDASAARPRRSPGKRAGRVEKEIVVRVVVDRRDLADDRGSRARLGVELVIEERRQPDRFAGANDEAMPCRHAARDPVERHADLAVVEAAVGGAVVDLADQGAAGAADDVLLLDRMAMHRRALALADDHRLFAIDGAAIGRRSAAVAKGERGEADAGEIAGGEIGDVPAELAGADLVAFLALAPPFLGRPEGERRQMEAVDAQHRLRAFDGGVDLRAQHPCSPCLSGRRPPRVDASERRTGSLASTRRCRAALARSCGRTNRAGWAGRSRRRPRPR